MHMPTVTVAAGIALVAVGFGFGLNTDPPAVDAAFMAKFSKFIPAVFGVVLVLCGAVAFKPSARKHAIHLALVFALFGVIGAGMRIPKTAGFGEGEGGSGAALASQLLMLLICAAVIALGIRSFIKARQARKIAKAAQT